MINYSKIFEKHITKAAKPDWFSASKHTLTELISKRNEALKDFKKKGTPASQELLKIFRWKL
jgi:hypothetical protein